MKIIFECVGFYTNPLFLLDTDNPDARPLPYGTIVDDQGVLDFWPENYMPDVVNEEQIRQAYKEMLDKDGVSIYDVSKQAWLDNRFGDKKE